MNAAKGFWNRRTLKFKITTMERRILMKHKEPEKKEISFIRARFRSSDLWVMGPPRFRCATLISMKISSCNSFMIMKLTTSFHGIYIWYLLIMYIFFIYKTITHFTYLFSSIFMCIFKPPKLICFDNTKGPRMLHTNNFCPTLF